MDPLSELGCVWWLHSRTDTLHFQPGCLPYFLSVPGAGPRPEAASTTRVPRSLFPASRRALSPVLEARPAEGRVSIPLPPPPAGVTGLYSAFHNRHVSTFPKPRENLKIE